MTLMGAYVAFQADEASKLAASLRAKQQLHAPRLQHGDPLSKHALQGSLCPCLLNGRANKQLGRFHAEGDVTPAVERAAQDDEAHPVVMALVHHNSLSLRQVAIIVH